MMSLLTTYRAGTGQLAEDGLNLVTIVALVQLVAGVLLVQLLEGL